MSDTAPPRRFSLDEASAVLPNVRKVTDDAVRACEQVVRRMERLAPGEPEHGQLGESLSAIVSRWTADVEALGGEVKGLWLVDFDNGQGYYCWRHPEPAITHFHGYDEGFAGRMTIV
jgi:hypothetical protein